jgi:hypothetical protein
MYGCEHNRKIRVIYCPFLWLPCRFLVAYEVKNCSLHRASSIIVTDNRGASCKAPLMGWLILWDGRLDFSVVEPARAASSSCLDSRLLGRWRPAADRRLGAMPRTADHRQAATRHGGTGIDTVPAVSRNFRPRRARPVFQALSHRYPPAPWRPTLVVVICRQTGLQNAYYMLRRIVRTFFNPDAMRGRRPEAGSLTAPYPGGRVAARSGQEAPT